MESQTSQLKILENLLREALESLVQAPPDTVAQLECCIRVQVTQDLLRRMRRYCQHDWKGARVCSRCGQDKWFGKQSPKAYLEGREEPGFSPLPGPRELPPAQRDTYRAALEPQLCGQARIVVTSDTSVEHQWMYDDLRLAEHAFAAWRAAGFEDEPTCWIRAVHRMGCPFRRRPGADPTKEFLDDGT